MKKVLFIDSGSGGVNVLAHAIQQGVGGDFLYFADLKNSPYGNKSKEELSSRVCEILDEVYKFFKFEIVVFACNTLTTSSIKFVREKYKNITFIGTEPAIKPALKVFEENDILVMATERTLYNMKLDGLTIKNLPSLIDQNLFNLENLTYYLKENLKPFKNKKAVVLGCTHYLAVKNIIQKILPNVKIFDSNDGVARRLKTFAGEGDFKVQFMTSENEPNPIISKYFHKLINFF